MGFRDLVEQLERGRAAGTPNLVVLERVDSTNLAARRIAAEYALEDDDPPRVLVVAHEQHAGRGRLGRSWTSPAGLGVYATLLLPLPAAELESLPLKVGVGLGEALERHLDGPCGLKWPNDLLVGGRKIGGVLIESVLRGGSAVAVVGFGVNHGQLAAELPSPAATSLRLEGRPLPALGDLVWDLVAGIDGALDRLPDAAAAVAAYAARSVHRRGDPLVCRVGEESVEGRFGGFDGRGFLRLETGAGERLLSAGEVVA